MTMDNGKRDNGRIFSLTIPMSAEEKRNIERASEDMTLSMAAFARMVLNQYIKNKEK